jgi:DNA-binding transcriptional LysR family regulator
MEVFVRVVELGGFSAAARVLGMSKSSVSKRVSALEDRLGAQLLLRTTRHLTLTDAGQAFHDRAVRILAETEDAEAAVSRLQAAPRGVLRVNAPVSFGVAHLGPLLPDFLARHPDLSVDLVLNDRVVDLVDEGFDVAIRIAPLAESSLVARRLCVSRRVLVASPGYVARHGAPRRPEEVVDHPCLLYAYLLRGGEWRLRDGTGAEAVLRVERPVLRANNGDVLCQAAVGGLGIAMMPTFIVGGDLAAGRLVRLLADWEDASGAIHAVWPHGRFTAPKVRAFVDFLVAAFRRPPWDDDKKYRLLNETN